MPVLIYCVTDAAAKIELPATGVHTTQLAAIEESGLRCTFSRYHQKAGAAGEPLREAAVEFNRVLQQVLEQTAIVPFRFPTVLAEEADIAALMREHASEYEESLSRVHDAVQMEITITANPQDPTQMKSGKQYLQARGAMYRKLEDAALNVQRLTADSLRDWRRRELPSGIRCYALISRDARAAFEQGVRRATTPADVQMRVSGPWPASEFLKES